MARTRNVSAHVTKANQRISGLSSIEANLDLGDGVSVASLTAARDQVVALMSEYNILLAQAAAKQNQLAEAEKALAGLNAKSLSLTKVRFGADSTQYEVVGGKRASERRRRRPIASGPA